MISEVVFSFDVDQVVMDLVHHHQAAVESTILERWPFEDVYHVCHATDILIRFGSPEPGLCEMLIGNNLKDQCTLVL